MIGREEAARYKRHKPPLVTPRGHEEPSAKQMAYLSSLVEATGATMPNVTTAGGASRAIDRLKKIEAAP